MATLQTGLRTGHRNFESHVQPAPDGAATLAHDFAINGAFLREIKDSAIELKNTTETVRHLCECPPWDMRCLRHLTEAMDRWRDQLAMVFTLEETYGYISLTPLSPRHEAPREGIPNPSELRREHGTLYLFVSELAEAMEELQFRGYDAVAMRDLVTRVMVFFERLDRHEQQEMEWSRC